MKFNKLTVLLFFLIAFSATAQNLDQYKPDNIKEQDWSSLKVAIQRDKLLPSPSGFGGGKETYLGASIVVDGNRALVSSVRPQSPTSDSCNSSNQGFVSVLEYDGKDWNKTANILQTNQSTNGCFGFSMSLYGNRALIGDFGASSVEYNKKGSAYLFEYDGSSWIETFKFEASDGVNEDFFGSSVAMDSSRIIIGAYGSDDDPHPYIRHDKGSVYIFEKINGNWSEVQKIMPTDSHEDQKFGLSVSISGNQLAVGAPGNLSQSGSVYVFEYSGNSLVENQKLIASDSVVFNLFGGIVNLDNDKLFVGARNSEAVYFFQKSGSLWTESQKITALDGSANDYFGSALDFKENRLVVGAPGNNNERGAAYVFDFNGTNWQINSKIIASDSSIDDFYGTGVAVSNQTVVVGSPEDDDMGEESGSVYFYGFDGAVWTGTQKYVTNESSYHDRFGATLDVSGNSMIIGAPFDDDIGSVYFYEKDSNWTLAQKLFLPEGDSVCQFISRKIVSISGDTAAVCGNAGVHIYKYNGSDWNEVQLITPLNSVNNAVDFFGSTIVFAEDQLFISETDSVYVYNKNQTIWEENQILVPNGNSQISAFGNSISVNGGKMIVGDFVDDSNGVRAGAVYFFEYDGVHWNETQKLSASDTTDWNYFGFNTGFLNNTAIITAPLKANGVNNGVIYFFEYDGVQWSQSSSIITSSGLENLDEKLEMSENGFYISGNFRNHLLVGTATRIYNFQVNESDWYESEIITSPNNRTDDAFGSSIAYSVNELIVGASLEDINGTDSGAVYIFETRDLIFENGFE